MPVASVLLSSNRKVAAVERYSEPSGVTGRKTVISFIHGPELSESLTTAAIRHHITLQLKRLLKRV